MKFALPPHGAQKTFTANSIRFVATQKLKPVRFFFFFLQTCYRIYLIHKDSAILQAVDNFSPRMSNFNTRPIREVFLVNTEAQKYEVCWKSIRLFWVSREPIAWPSCNLTGSQRRLYCASANSHSPVGLVSRQWGTVEWTCALRDRRIHISPPFQLRFWLCVKPDIVGSQIWAVGGLTDLGYVMLCQESLQESCRMDKRIVEMKLNCSLGHVNATVTQYTNSVNGVSLPTN